MFNITTVTKDKSDQYGQMRQPNPLRYQFAQRNKRDLKLTSAPMSCRDFFNDAVATYNGFTPDQYGYDSSQIKFNRYGLYVYYTNVQNPEQFVHNIEQAINPRLKSDTGSVVVAEIQDAHSVVVRIPTEVLKYTWTMSMLTQLIRNSNYGVSYNAWDELFTNWPTQESNWYEMTRKICYKQGFKPLFDNWWYAGKDFNSNGVPYPQTTRQFLSTIHGNGCNSICIYAQREGVIKEKN